MGVTECTNVDTGITLFMKLTRLSAIEFHGLDKTKVMQIVQDYAKRNCS